MDSCNINIEASYQDDIELRNMVDNEVKSMLYPLNLMQILVLNPKYCMKNNFIQPNNRINKFILICGLVILLLSYINRLIEIVMDENIRRYLTIKFLSFASLFDFAYYGAGFIINVILNFMYSKKIIAFVVIFQEVHRFINNEASFKWSVIRNWVNVVVIFTFYFVTWLFMTVIFNQSPWYVVMNLIVLISLDTNIVYAISSVEILADKVKLWNDRVSQSVGDGQNGNREINCDLMLETYVHILKCYNISKKIFQRPVS